MKHYFSSLIIFYGLHLMLVACGPELETAVSPTPLPATATMLPTATAVSSSATAQATSTPQATAVSSPTPTPATTPSWHVTAVNPVTIYSGPSSEFAPVGTMTAGVTARIIGGGPGEWRLIECPDGGPESCWVLWGPNDLYAYEGPPQTLNIPDPTDLTIEGVSTAVSPNGRWQTEVTRSDSEIVSSTNDWLPFFYVEFKVTSLEDGTTWTPVSEWHSSGLGAEDPPQVVHWSRDGRYLYYTSISFPDGACMFYDNIGGYLDRLDLSDGSVVALQPPLAGGILTISSDEQLLAYLSGGYNLVVRELAAAYDKSSQDSVKWEIPLDVVQPNFRISSVEWSPDSQKVLVTALYEGCPPPGDYSAWELNVKTGILTKISEFVPTPEPTPIPCPIAEAKGDMTRDTFLIFCGGHDNVGILLSDPLITGHALTVEAYVNYLADGGESPQIFIEASLTFSFRFFQNKVWFCLLPHDDREGREGKGEWVCVSHQQPEPGQWVHVAGSWDGQHMYLFYDGELQAKNDFTGPLFHGPADRHLNIGNGQCICPDTFEGFPGYIDEVRVSSISRYDADFEPQPQFTADELTVALWHFDEGQGSVAADESGNEHHGSLSPFVRWGSQP